MSTQTSTHMSVPMSLRMLIRRYPVNHGGGPYSNGGPYVTQPRMIYWCVRTCCNRAFYIYHALVRNSGSYSSAGPHAALRPAPAPSPSPCLYSASSIYMIAITIGRYTALFIANHFAVGVLPLQALFFVVLSCDTMRLFIALR